MMPRTSLLIGVRKAATFVAILLGAAMLIKFMTFADETLASRHTHVFVRDSQLLSTLRAVCDSHVCQRYSWELQASLDVSRNPCHSLYDFVCGRWRRAATAPSVRESAENRLLTQAMLSVVTANSSDRAPDVVSETVTGLVRSCLHARGDPSELVGFLSRRGILPYKWRGPYGVLKNLVDLSVNWDIHVWFDLSIAVQDTATPIVHIRTSAAFEEWIKVFKKMGRTEKYKRNLENTFRLLGLRNEHLTAALHRASIMNTLVSAVLRSARRAPDSGPLALNIGQIAATLTPAVPATAWLGALRAVVSSLANISEETFVHVKSSRVLRALNSLFEFGKNRQEHLAEHIAYRTFVEIGWMVDERNSTMRPFQLSPENLETRCLRAVEKMAGRAWYSLFPALPRERPQRDVLTLVQFINASAGNIGGPYGASVPADVLPPFQPSFFANWVAYREAKRDLESSGIYDILRIDRVEDRSWQRGQNWTVEPLIFSYPFFHTQLHPAVNFAGAGRLLARALLSLSPANVSAQEIEEKAVAAALRALHESPETPDGRAAALPNTTAVDELFFMASCYAVCDTEDIGHTARNMCDGPAMRLRSYAAAFGCKPPLEKMFPPQETYIDFRI
ncbi:hypothetical protein V5799_013021 [Amblyomma americanum]|uniref:Peptidase M13 N-terminal domain-containing protein n=2 Tax=Amblyomma americanum TaxID=6943 RepID=A0AAQ4E757_AMBAM